MAIVKALVRQESINLTILWTEKHPVKKCVFHKNPNHSLTNFLKAPLNYSSCVAAITLELSLSKIVKTTPVNKVPCFGLFI